MEHRGVAGGGQTDGWVDRASCRRVWAEGGDQAEEGCRKLVLGAGSGGALS